MYKIFKALWVCVIGTILEWYDFALFASLIPILSKLFFPSQNHFISLMATFGAFASGFLMRPLGAIFFGSLGDRYGRKNILVATTFTMTVPTVLIGILPTYQQAGILAPFFLTVLRMIQGFSASGEYSGAIIFLSELSRKKHRNFIASFSIFGVAGGMALGTIIGAVIAHILTDHQLMLWGWRIPFLASIVLGALGIYMRLRVIESPEFTLLNKELVPKPITQVLHSKPYAILSVIGLFWLNIIIFYIIFVFVPANFFILKNLSLQTTLWLNFIGLLVIVCFTPFFGYLSDRFGEIRIAFIGGLLTLLITYPLFSLYTNSTVFGLLIIQLCFALITAWYVSPIPVLVSSLFPTNLRYSGVALGQGIAASILGGTAPLIATFLSHISNNNRMVGFYIILSSIISLGTIYSIRNIKRY